MKIALREVGNQLLLKSNDSSTLVLPIVKLEKNKYELSFEKHLEIFPNNVVKSIQKNFTKAALPQQYRVEIIDCNLVTQVVYSYEMRKLEEKTIIPCSGRVLPQQCYKLQLKFLPIAAVRLDTHWPLWTAVALIFSLFGYFIYQRKRGHGADENDASYASIGSFRFYEDQNKLVKEAVEIPLSKKECEILAIFVAQPNHIITRDELSKRVWEDNGVIVGRSLDTYISKLRKKLQDDTAIQLRNVHGVGYKLEVME